MEKNKNIAKYKNFLLYILLIVAIIITFFIFLRPKILGIFEIRKNIVSQRKKLSSLTQKEMILRGLDEAELTKKTEFLLKVLPPEQDIANILLVFKALSFSTDISIQGVKIDGDIFSLKVQGSQEKIINFMEKIEKTYPLMRIEEVAFSFTKDNPLADLKIKTFFLSLPTQIGTLDSPVSLATSEEEKIYQEISSQLVLPPISAKEDLTATSSGRENPFVF